MKPYQENVAATELFYTLSDKTAKASFEEYMYADKLYQDELKQLVAMLREHKFYMVFPLQGSKFIFHFGSTCATKCKFLSALPKF